MALNVASVDTMLVVASYTEYKCLFLESLITIFSHKRSTSLYWSSYQLRIVFYAFRGLLITLGCVATFPFAQEKLIVSYLTVDFTTT